MFGFGFRKKDEKPPKSFPPRIRTKVFPGVQSQKLTEGLKRFECPAITYIGEAFPVFLKKAYGCNVEDVDGNRYLDFTAGFGVMNLGYNHRVVLKAIQAQSRKMIHGLGDIHPTEIKVNLAKRLSEITPGNLNQTIFSSTGSEAVESALKTAMVVTKKPGVIAFAGAYHGLGYGALALTHRDYFRKPFQKQLGKFAYFAAFPNVAVYGAGASDLSLKAVQRLYKKAKRTKAPVGAVILEPILGRGGVVPCPADFLKKLRLFCDEEKILLIADEVYTGFGRTGSLFAVDKSGVVPDLLCIGKAMGNGLPISACIGTTRVMYGWGASTGEAVHTSTYLGHPLGAAVALAVIDELIRKKYADRSRQLGEFFRKELWKLKQKYLIIGDIRGAGLMIGVELSREQGVGAKMKRVVPASDKAKLLMNELLKKGLIVLLSGEFQNVLCLTPPLLITEKEIQYFVHVLDDFFKKNV